MSQYREPHEIGMPFPKEGGIFYFATSRGEMPNCFLNVLWK